MKTFFILECFVACAFAEEKLNYCRIILCSSEEHIGCNSTETLNITCPETTEIVEFTPTVIKAIVDTHNKLRNELAGGKFSGFKAAARMATMQWDDELAYFASINVYGCDMKLDRCPNTEKYPMAGQSKHSLLTNNATSDEFLFASLVNSWFSKYKNATMAEIDKAPDLLATRSGDFLSKAEERNIAVGCGAVKYPLLHKPGWFRGYFACNYANSCYRGTPIYKSSDVPASDCKEKNPDYPNLCSVNEVYELYFQKPY